MLPVAQKYSCGRVVFLNLKFNADIYRPSFLAFYYFFCIALNQTRARLSAHSDTCFLKTFKFD